ncbi:hypothetical protein G9F72_014250 [Clostridium estertheticum]|uniref:hypothetical protein n=1 Tax=Clostridium estertheticum TaxID=238834 RepID=UPI0013E9852F|nr:hypothetical protein [Clostridium estertheticum]MBZ9687489.1 hypothetical protein [Clostridium estertheticum]
MNTTGFIRGYMVKNMNAEGYLNVVVNALSMEFDTKVLVQNISEDDVRIVMANFEVIISLKYINELSKPYGIDKFILESLAKKGFNLDINISQYIQYCFGIYN